MCEPFDLFGFVFLYLIEIWISSGVCSACQEVFGSFGLRMFGCICISGGLSPWVWRPLSVCVCGVCVLTGYFLFCGAFWGHFVF